MTNFEIDFTTNLRSLKLKKKDVAKKLNMTPPTLKTKIQKPEKITLLDYTIYYNLDLLLI